MQRHIPNNITLNYTPLKTQNLTHIKNFIQEYEIQGTQSGTAEVLSFLVRYAT